MQELYENQFGVERRQQPGEKPSSIERRRHKRYAVEGEAEVIIHGLQLFRGSVVDLSLGGCFIETQARPNAAIGTHADLVFRANGLMVRTMGSFRVFRQGCGAGFVFVRMDDATRQHLEALIASLEAAD